MARKLILGQIHPDLACAIALGFVNNHRVAVTLESITIYDVRLQTNRTQKGWLESDDHLDRVTREFLLARREALLGKSRTNGNGKNTPATTSRETPNTRALLAKKRAREILQERGILGSGREPGLGGFDPG